MSITINIAGWLLFEVLSNGTVSTAQFPTEALCKEGQSIAMTGRTIAEEAAFQDQERKRQAEAERARAELAARAVIQQCGIVPCKVKSYQVGNCTHLTENGGFVCAGPMSISTWTTEDNTVPHASSARCFPIPVGENQ